MEEYADDSPGRSGGSGTGQPGTHESATGNPATGNPATGNPATGKSGTGAAADRAGARRRAWTVGRALRAVVPLANAVNLSTPLGIAVAVAGRARLSRGPRGLLLGTSYRLGVPQAVAFTVGNVILTRLSRDDLLARPALLAHEERHTWQYAACLGLPMIPLYLAACGWSWVRSRDFASSNVFERLAGLADGGYPDARRSTGRGRERPTGDGTG
ncbi:hypothetical protein ABN028_00195 [Actinopolymorpha sp. B17G11]|uniref:hypothetical protein n=1 Tax=Actinopolymorpha sp. B17G11 TaxID=3160861 RepID=UPI0032E460EA